MAKFKNLNVVFTEDQLIDIHTHEIRFLSNHPQGIGIRELIYVETLAFDRTMAQLEGDAEDLECVAEDLLSYYRFCSLVQADEDAYRFIEDLFSRFMTILRNLCVSSYQYPSVIRVVLDSDGYGEEIGFNISEKVFFRPNPVAYKDLKSPVGFHFYIKMDDCLMTMESEDIIRQETINRRNGVDNEFRDPCPSEVAFVLKFLQTRFVAVRPEWFLESAEIICAVGWLGVRCSTSDSYYSDCLDIADEIKRIIEHLVGVRTKHRGYCSDLDVSVFGALAIPVNEIMTSEIVPLKDDKGSLVHLAPLWTNLNYSKVFQFSSQVLFYSRRAPFAYTSKKRISEYQSHSHTKNKVQIVNGVFDVQIECLSRWLSDRDLFSYRVINKKFYNLAVDRFNLIKKLLFSCPDELIMDKYNWRFSTLPYPGRGKRQNCASHGICDCLLCFFKTYDDMDKYLRQGIVRCVNNDSKKKVKNHKGESFLSFCDRVLVTCGKALLKRSYFCFLDCYRKLNHAVGFLCADSSVVRLFTFLWLMGLTDMYVSHPDSYFRREIDKFVGVTRGDNSVIAVKIYSC